MKQKEIHNEFINQLIKAIQNLYNGKADIQTKDDKESNDEDGYGTTINYKFDEKLIVSLSATYTENRVTILSGVFRYNDNEPVPVKAELSAEEKSVIKGHLSVFYEIGDRFNEQLYLEEHYDENIN